jgi:hypothetical protein
VRVNSGRGRERCDAERACARGVGGGGGGSRAVGLDDALPRSALCLSLRLKKEVMGWEGGGAEMAASGTRARGHVPVSTRRSVCWGGVVVRWSTGSDASVCWTRRVSAVGNKKWLRVAGRVHRAVLGTACVWSAKKLPTGFDFCSLSGSSVLRELAGFRGSVEALFRPCLALLSWDAKLSWTIVRRGWPRLLKPTLLIRSDEAIRCCRFALQSYQRPRLRD